MVQLARRRGHSGLTQKNGPLLSTRSDDDDDDMLLIKVCVIPLTIVLSVKFSGMHENY